MRFETIAIHAGERPDAAFGAVSVPIYSWRGKRKKSSRALPG